MESKKRERSANFNNAEVQLLISLVENYKDIIENKKTDAVTNRDKECSWKKIEHSFNSCGVSTTKRCWKTLKLKYEGIKKSSKKKSSLQRQEMYKTGGGSTNAPEFTDVETKVMSICSNIKGLDARHDSDKIPSESKSVSDIVLTMEEDKTTRDNNGVNNNGAEDMMYMTQDISINIPDMDVSLVQDKNDGESQKENKWDKWHPKALKTKVSNILKSDIAHTANKASVTSKLDKLSSARLELVAIQIETAKKEQQYKEQEHKLKMEQLANDERRKQEIHVLLLQKLNYSSVNDIDINNC